MKTHLGGAMKKGDVDDEEHEHYQVSMRREEKSTARNVKHGQMQAYCGAAGEQEDFPHACRCHWSVKQIAKDKK